MRAVSGRDRRNADDLAIALTAELDRTGAQGEQGVILEVSEQETTLLNYHRSPHRRADNGTPGRMMSAPVFP